MALKPNNQTQSGERLSSEGENRQIRLAIVGSSHLAALKLAEQRGLVQAEGFDICFYGGAGALFTYMVCQDRFLDMKSAEHALLVTDGKYETLPIDDFDAFLFHGAGYSYSAFLRRFNLAGLPLNKVSAAFLQETARQSLDLPFAARKVALQVLEDVDVPVVISPTPLKAQRSKLFENTVVADTDMHSLDVALGKAFEERGMHYVAQPTETISDNIYTDDRFTTGSVRLKGELEEQHGDEDFGHMNAEYGALVLRDALAKIRGLVEQRWANSRRRTEARKRRMRK